MRLFLAIGIPLAVVGLLVFLFTRRLRARLTYGESGFTADVRVCGIRVFSTPKKKKEVKPLSARALRRKLEKDAKKAAKDAAQKEKKKQKKAAKKQETAGKAKKKLTVAELRELLSILFEFLSDGLYRHLETEIDTLRLTVATPDAAKTALEYSAIVQGVTALLELLDHGHKLTITHADSLSVQPDFLADKLNADLDVSFAARIHHLLAAVLRAGWRYLKMKLKSSAGGKAPAEA